MKTSKVCLLILLLVIIDQVIKIVINNYFLDIRFDIIPGLFEFKPTFNDRYLYINHLFDLNIGFWGVILLNCFAFLIIFAFYSVFRNRISNTKLLDIAFNVLYAGLISAFIGTVFWNGCLDYIYLKPLFVFDLKDIGAFIKNGLKDKYPEDK